MIFGVSKNVFSDSALLMFVALQMEISPDYNFLPCPIWRLWERAREGCNACSSDLFSCHWILVSGVKELLVDQYSQEFSPKALCSWIKKWSFPELFNQTLKSVTPPPLPAPTLDLWNSSGFYIWFRILPSLKILRGKAASEWLAC